MGSINDTVCHRRSLTAARAAHTSAAQGELENEPGPSEMSSTRESLLRHPKRPERASRPNCGAARRPVRTLLRNRPVPACRRQPRHKARSPLPSTARGTEETPRRSVWQGFIHVTSRQDAVSDPNTTDSGDSHQIKGRENILRERS